MTKMIDLFVPNIIENPEFVVVNAEWHNTIESRCRVKAMSES